MTLGIVLSLGHNGLAGKGPTGVCFWCRGALLVRAREENQPQHSLMPLLGWDESLCLDPGHRVVSG